MSQKNLRVFSENTGKLLGGGAAQLKHIKDNGGWDQYHRMIAQQAVEACEQQIIDLAVDAIMREQSKPRLRVVNGTDYD